MPCGLMQRTELFSYQFTAVQSVICLPELEWRSEAYFFKTCVIYQQSFLLQNNCTLKKKKSKNIISYTVSRYICSISTALCRMMSVLWLLRRLSLKCFCRTDTILAGNTISKLMLIDVPCINFIMTLSVKQR